MEGERSVRGSLNSPNGGSYGKGGGPEKRGVNSRLEKSYGGSQLKSKVKRNWPDVVTQEKNKGRGVDWH